jgi:F0F1-type ATP synthase assembly protein I
MPEERQRPTQTLGEAVRTVGALSAVGLTFVLAVVLGAGLGYLIDRWFGTSPWGFLVCFFLGMAAGVRAVMRTVASVTRRDS